MAASTKAAAAPDSDLFGGEEDDLLVEEELSPGDEEPGEQSRALAESLEWQDGVDAATGRFLWFSPEECEDDSPALVSSTDEEGEAAKRSKSQGALGIERRIWRPRLTSGNAAQYRSKVA